MPYLNPEIVLCAGHAAIAWACARLGFHPGPLLGVLAERIAAEVPSLSPATLSHTVWAFAALDYCCPALLHAVAAAAAPRLRLYSAQVHLSSCARTEQTGSQIWRLRWVGPAGKLIHRAYVFQVT